MFSSFSTAVSALAATSTAIDVVGNNLANLNTPGFKASIVSFHDLISQSFQSGFGEAQIGFGVARPTTLRQFTQGAIQTTSGPLDAAIQGDGFFIVKDHTGGTLYTRSGNLQVDKGGTLITATGEKVQGWTTLLPNGQVDTNGPYGDVVVPAGTLKAPSATQQISLDMNLNAAAVVGDQFSTSLEVFDSLSTSHIIKIVFTKAAGQWDYSISIPDADLTAPYTPVTGSLTFDSNGKLATPAPTDPMPVIPITGLADGASDMSITWNLYNGTAPRISQYSQTSAVAVLSQDGSPAANLNKLSIGDGGKIIAQYNGQQVAIGQLAMALVRNPESLLAVGNNNLALSARSAIPAVGVANSGGRGSVVGGAIEASTVDIAKEFTSLIVLQRGYQANAKVVTAVDELSQDTINLKR